MKRMMENRSKYLYSEAAFVLLFIFYNETLDFHNYADVLCMMWRRIVTE